MAQLHDSTFRYTDPNVTAFVVKSFTANGPSSPASSVLYTNSDGVSSVSANTSLVLVGRGTPYYGEVVLGNMIYMMEHFAYQSRPLYPVIGQIWYKKADYTDTVYPSDPIKKGLYLWDGSTWTSIVAQNALSPQLNLNDNRIINLGNAVADTDALNRQTGDGRYIRVIGGIMSGELTLDSDGSIYAQTGATISMIDNPFEPEHVVNYGYFTLAQAATQAAINVVDDRVDALTVILEESVGPEGGTFTGTITLNNTSTLIAQSGGPALLLGGRQLSNIAVLPVAANDAASKQYVDDGDAVVAATVATNAIAIQELEDDLIADYLRKDGGNMTGTLALGSTAHFALSAGGLATFGFRVLGNVGYPTQLSDAATKEYVDVVTGGVSSTKVRRSLQTQAGATTTFSVPANMQYVVDQNKLQVYVDGVKQYADTRGKSTVTFTDTAIDRYSSTGLTPSTLYTVNVTVDGGAPVALNLTTNSSAPLYFGLVNMLNTAAALAGIDVFFTVDDYSATEMEIVCTSHTTGPTSSVVLSYGVGSLFEAITTSAAPVSTAGATYSYAEVGDTGATSTSFTFGTAPTIGSVIEMVLIP